MKLFKNFQTKRQLRKEIERLNFLLHRPEPIHFVEREVEKVCSSMDITDIPNEVPIEHIKKRIANNFAEYLEPFIEWDIEDSSDNNRYGKVVKGSLYLAKRK